MLAKRRDGTISLPPHGSLQSGQLLTDMDDLTLDEQLLARGCWAEICDVERAADAHELPIARLRDENDRKGSAVVEEGGCAATVEVL